MLTIKVEGFGELLKKIENFPKQLNRAVDNAMFRTALKIKDAEKEEIRRVFDRPVRWTVNSMMVKKDKGTRTISVGIIDPAGMYKRTINYLGVQVTGGSRHLKAMEKALQHYGLMPKGWFIVPGEAAKIDSYGNISVGEIRQILSFFDAAERTAGSTQNMGVKGRERRRKGTRTSLGFEYFIVNPGSFRSFNRANGKVGRHKMQPGVYRRTFAGAYQIVQPIMIFVSSVFYKPRFDFQLVARQTYEREMPIELQAAIDKELSRLAGKQS